MTTTTSFTVETTDTNPGFNKPQKMGRALWKPMWLMAIMSFTAAIIVAGSRASQIAAGADQTTTVALGHVGTGLMFIGFTSVFASISFAIARILGEFRDGGGRVQETLGIPVVGLKMPGTARAFIMLMVVAMMTILVAVIIHFGVAASVSSGSLSLEDAENTAIILEAVRRLGVSVYLVAIALGLGTITRVLSFQTQRIIQLPKLAGRVS